jgi:uncharacterized protein (DUF342 family)
MPSSAGGSTAEDAGVPTFVFDSSHTTLFGLVGAELAPWPSDIDALRAVMAEAGAADWQLVDEGVALLREPPPQGASPRQIKLAQKRDGYLKLDASDDLMEATLAVFPAAGGVSLSEQAARNALRAGGIVVGIDLEALREAVMCAASTPVVVARGTAPQAGQDAVVRLALKDPERGPTVDAKGRADLHELNMLPLVRKGDLLMEKRPATKGTPGQNVIGEQLPARDGTDVEFDLTAPGVMIDPRSPLRLLAAVPGRAVVGKNGQVCVERAIEVAEVSAATGNVRFDGSVTIKGDVKPGFKVVASGSVFVGGRVEGADMEVQGDLLVRGGIVGHLSNRISVGGSLEARFIENADVEAKGNAYVADSIVRADITVGEALHVGAHGKGRIIDSRIHAAEVVTATAIGAPGDAGTLIDVTGHGLAPAEMLRLEAACRDAALLVDKYVLLARKAQAMGRDETLDTKLSEVRLHVLNRLLARMRALLDGEDLAEDEDVTIGVTSGICEGVLIRLNGIETRVGKDTGPGAFVWRNGELVFERRFDDNHADGAGASTVD